MYVLGLTGGMGAGKTTVAGLLKRRGWPVFDADAVVHGFQSAGGEAVPAIAARWPQAVRQGGIDREALRCAVLGDPSQIIYLESIIHPLVSRARKEFLRHARRRCVRNCVLDIPLLFETGVERECTDVLVVTAPFSVRLQRIMRRRSLSEAQARALLARQMTDSVRCRHADFVVQTGLSRFHTMRQIRGLVNFLERE